MRTGRPFCLKSFNIHESSDIAKVCSRLELSFREGAKAKPRSTGIDRHSEHVLAFPTPHTASLTHSAFPTHSALPLLLLLAPALQPWYSNRPKAFGPENADRCFLEALNEARLLVVRSGHSPRHHNGAHLEIVLRRAPSPWSGWLGIDS